MTLVRPQGEISAAGNPAQKNSSTQRRTVPLVGRTVSASLVGLALLGIASSASALIITGPGTACRAVVAARVSGVTTTGTGATLSCTGIVLSGHTNVYFGIRNTVSPNGNTMTGADPAAGPGSEVFRISATTASSITLHEHDPFSPCSSAPPQSPTR